MCESLSRGLPMADDRDVVDMFTSLPTPERIASEIRSWGAEAGYRQAFGGRWSTLLGIDASLIDAVADLSAVNFMSRAVELLTPALGSTQDSVSRLRAAGIVRAVIHGPLIADVPVSNDYTAELAEQAPDLLVPFARIDPRASDAIAEITRCASLGMRGITITPFWHGVSVDDDALDPLMRTAADLGLIAWLHTSMNWKRTAPLELEHPRHIDVLAGRYTDLDIVCGHGGWPWMTEMVATAWRHPNVFIEVSAFRPKNLFRPNSGWDPLVYYGERTIRDRLLFGSTWTLLGMEPSELVAEAWESPWSDRVKRQWLHDNGRRLLDRA